MTCQTFKFRNFEKLLIILFLSLIFICCSTAYAQEANKSTIKVTVADLKTDDGKIKVEVYDTEENWLKKTAYEFTCKIKDQKCECTMENIPYGDYALFVYQDENSNDKLDVQQEIIPKEPFGYSKVTQMIMGPARWSDAQISINTPSVEVPVKLMKIQFGN